MAKQSALARLPRYPLNVTHLTRILEIVLNLLTPRYILCAAALLLSACGGGSNGTDGAAGLAGSNGNNGSNGLTSLILVSVEPTGANCTNGGSRISAGLDSNGNTVLDPSEISSTQYVCNGAGGAAGATGSTGGTGATGSTGATGAKGATGATGATGAAGAAGAAGVSTLVSMSNEPAGVNCASGGKKISAGPDSNSNGVLDANEITTTGYVCNGTNGAVGATGAVGNNGLNSLVAAVVEPAGGNCMYGGSRITAGLDTNGNGVLDANEVTTTTYTCNGTPGANGTNGATGAAGPGITWANVTGTSVQAAPNTGYLANNAGQVNVTLPTSAVLGDIVQISGIGAGGWKIVQNAGQTIFTEGVMGNVGALWTSRDATRSWQSIASSADGSKLVAAAYNGQLFT